MGVDPSMICGLGVVVGRDNLGVSCSVFRVFGSGYLGSSEMVKSVQS